MPTKEEAERRVHIGQMDISIKNVERNVETILGYFQGKDNIFTRVKLNSLVSKGALLGVILLGLFVVDNDKLTEIVKMIF